MRCRKLYKNENQDNYNLVFFKSKGTRMPSNIKCSLSESDSNGNQNIFGEAQEIFPHENGEHIEFVYRYNDSQMTLTLDLYYDETSPSDFSITNINVVYDSMTAHTTERFYISFFSEETEGKKNIIYQNEFALKEINSKFQTEDNSIPDIYYKDICLAIKENDNYADKQEAVAYSLTQRLSIIKGELWYRINHGLPLLDKVRSGAIFDSVIINIILSHPEVKNIVSFSSSVENHSHYKFNAIISTIYNIDIEIGKSY